jgi:hypothetical protein
MSHDSIRLTLVQNTYQAGSRAISRFIWNSFRGFRLA